ncbi:hypothetical protein [Actinobacillus equuli]|uniref:hypothetical protein n=1 Tax=Actinobacillus equuli TaxID=718 RepID=UPI0024410294|nr:hypothetical protein [Actinobacillus equuli]WGE42127.1 hypothetical protein NYR64_10480 [Actinobacillus equuli subsp. haemolyticus]
MIRDWNDFEENIDHEMKECEPVSKKANRVDEKKGHKEGIRNHSQISAYLGNANIKSCDYFLVDKQKNNFYCVEFSDLLAQRASFPILSQTQITSAIRKHLCLKNTGKHVIKKITKIIHPKKIIKDELISKIKDTDLLIKYIYSSNFNRITNLPNIELDKYFFIVYKDNSLSDDNKRYFDDILSDMKISDLNKSLCSLNHSVINSKNIFFLNLEDFKSRYC